MFKLQKHLLSKMTVSAKGRVFNVDQFNNCIFISEANSASGTDFITMAGAQELSALVKRLEAVAIRLEGAQGGAVAAAVAGKAANNYT